MKLFVSVRQAITILVKNVKSSKISETQLQVLLGYAEEDIYDQSRQATAFGLLKVSGGAQVETLSQRCGLLSCVFTCDWMCPPGDPIEEASCSRDGGGDEKSVQAVYNRQQLNDKGPLSTGTRRKF